MLLLDYLTPQITYSFAYSSHICYFGLKDLKPSLTVCLSVSLSLPSPPPEIVFLSWLGPGQKSLRANLNTWGTAVIDNPPASLKCVPHSLSWIPQDFTQVFHSSTPPPFMPPLLPNPLPFLTLHVLPMLPGVTSQIKCLHPNPPLRIYLREEIRPL